MGFLLRDAGCAARGGESSSMGSTRCIRALHVGSRSPAAWFKACLASCGGGGCVAGLLMGLAVAGGPSGSPAAVEGGGTGPPRRLYVNDKRAPESIRDLLKIEEALKEAFQRVRKAAVGIDLGEGAGSGVIVSEDGLVLTAAHVSGGVDKEVTVILEDGSRVEARSLGLASDTDCAMLQIEGEGPFPHVELDREDTARLGDWVFSLGHSGGFDGERGVAVRLGRLVRVAEETIQSDCKLIGGDSGGPLFDMNGRLIGIHSRVGRSNEENMHVPIRVFLRHWEDLRAGEFLGEGPFAKRPGEGGAFLGVATADREEGGVEITDIVEVSAASEADLKVGDVILKVGGEGVEDREAFSELIGGKKPGEVIKLVVLRDEEELEIEVELGER